MSDNTKTLYPKPAFYCAMYGDLKEEARQCGYALAIHGSLNRDFDLIAVPWVDNPVAPDELANRLNECFGGTIYSDWKFTLVKKKPHGRIAYTLPIMGDWYIDLSIISPQQN